MDQLIVVSNKVITNPIPHYYRWSFIYSIQFNTFIYWWTHFTFYFLKLLLSTLDSHLGFILNRLIQFLLLSLHKQSVTSRHWLNFYFYRLFYFIIDCYERAPLENPTAYIPYKLSWWADRYWVKNKLKLNTFQQIPISLLLIIQ